MRALLMIVAAALSAHLLVAQSWGADQAVGQINVEHKGPRPLPATASKLQFTGLAADNTTMLFGPVISDPRPRVQLKRVPVTVKILRIDYLDGTTPVGLFEGFVQVNPSKTTVVRDPPWVTVPPCHTAPPDELGQFGALLDEFGTVAVAVALPPRTLPDTHDAESASGSFPLGSPLPGKVALDNLPPVGMQGTIPHLGSPGSCIAWSFGYGLGSYTAAHNPDGTIRWDPRDSKHQVSPAFLYPLIHSQETPPVLCPTGSSEGYLAQLVAEGAPSMAQVPYAPDCCYLNAIDVNQQFPREERFRIGSFAHIPLPAKTGVDHTVTLTLLKEFLAAGMAVAFAGPVFTDFNTLPLDHGVFYPTGWCTSSPECGHGMLLVGYDDGLGDPAKGLGAFLVQNSFGTNWPPGPSPAPPGRFYLSYQGFLDSQLNAQVAYPLDRSGPRTPPLKPSAPGGPKAYITAAYQWEDTSGGNPVPSYLILLHRFSKPVELMSVTVAEPDPSTASATQTNGYPIGNGYTYFRRQDGRSWLVGDYQVTIVAADASGQSFTYTGTVSVGPPSASLPPLPAATMPTVVVGTTGQPAQVRR